MKNTLKQGDLQYLPASDLRWLAKHYCKHTKPLLAHPACFKGQTDTPPRILLFDLETTANSGFYWGKNWETSIIQNTSYGQILSYAARWLGEKTFVRGWCDFRRNKELGLVKELWQLLDEADYVVAHNGRSFDIKWCNTRFSFYKMSPPSPYKIIDTKLEAKKYLYLPSNSLNNIADYFGLGCKVEHEGFPLWRKCIKGDPKAWVRMLKYNKNDVDLLAKVYAKLAPFGKKIV